MPDETTILSLPLILPAQAQKHVTHNEAIVKLDLIVQLSVLSRNDLAPPVTPVVGDRYIVGGVGIGAWTGQDQNIALFTLAGWEYTTPLLGWQAYLVDESQMAFFDGTGWIALSDGPFTVGRLGIGATPDATNRLSVVSPATLLNHAGAGHQVKVNKAASTDTAALLFQTGFSGRAEMGTAGSDDFSVKVSADGSTFFDALIADRTNGRVTLPQPLLLGGQAADPGTPANGTIWLNTTTGEVKVRTNGATVVVGTGGGGGVTDGDKGDITVSGSGATWTIDANAVTLAKIAQIATDSFLGRDTAATGNVEVLTPAQARGILNVADGATANASDASLRDRATHTGTQAAATITGLAATATSTDAANLTGTLAAARLPAFGSGDVSFAAAGGAGTIAANAVGNTKLADMAANTIKGNATAATADPADIAVGTNTVLGRVAGNIVAAQLVDAQVAAATLTNAKLANVATATLKGRATAGTGSPEDLTGTQATALLDAFTSGAKGLAPASGGGTTNFLRADGTWAAPPGGGGVTDGDKGDITVSGSGATWTIDANVVTLSKIAQIATDSFLGRDTAATGNVEVLTPAQARGILNVADGATANASDAALRDRATHTGTQAAATITGLAATATSTDAANLTGTLAAARLPAFGSGDVSFAAAGGAGTIAANAVTLAKMAQIATASILGRTTAGTGNVEVLTATQATALLDVFTSGAKGLAPASGGGTTNFLRADGTWAAPGGGGGGSPGGATGDVQYNDGAGGFAGAADVEIEGGQLRLNAITTPATPAAGGLKLYAKDIGGRIMPTVMGPSGLELSLQSFFGRNKIGMFIPLGNGGTDSQVGIVVTAVGTAQTTAVATGSFVQYIRRREWAVTTAAATAVAGLRGSNLHYTVGGNAARRGGFLLSYRWGVGRGGTVSTLRAFAGMSAAGAPTDVNPSTLLNIVGMGWDNGDTNIQFMYNDGTGAATKVDLGASFPRPAVADDTLYEVILFSPPGTTQSVGYKITDLKNDVTTSGVVTTNLPSTTTLLAPNAYVSVGGTSSVIGIVSSGIYIETDN